MLLPSIHSSEARLSSPYCSVLLTRARASHPWLLSARTSPPTARTTGKCQCDTLVDSASRLISLVPHTFRSCDISDDAQFAHPAHNAVAIFDVKVTAVSCCNSTTAAWLSALLAHSQRRAAFGLLCCDGDDGRAGGRGAHHSHRPYGSRQLRSQAGASCKQVGCGEERKQRVDAAHCMHGTEREGSAQQRLAVPPLFKRAHDTCMMQPHVQLAAHNNAAEVWCSST